jgi:hypothetical protein
MFVLSRLSVRARKVAVGLGLLCGLAAAGCSKVQMGYNVLSFDTAIADTANQQLLLNAVRSSQHYPKSFTQPGNLKATPPVSGGLDSVFNLTRFDGLGAYSFTPKIAVDGGYSEFSLSNLNYEEYMNDIRDVIPPRITDTFRRNSNWPGQLRDLLYVQKFELSEQMLSFIDSRRKSICRFPLTDSQTQRCDVLQEQIAEFEDQCNGDQHFSNVAARIDRLRGDPGIYFNTASNYCHYNRFRIFLEEVRLIGPKIICSKQQKFGCVREIPRSALDMIGYLGELIAAQNYISEPFMPKVAVGIPVGPHFRFVQVPLFEVRIGPPGGPASVLVKHEAALYYIPRPDFGSPLEARSMQTLDLVLQTVQAATKKEDVPKNSQTVTTIPLKKG